MYIRNGVNWYKLFDDYVDSITVVSEALSNVLSVTQLDEQNLASSAQSQLPDLIDPYAPPGCSVHPSTRSSCVFRPCSHVACPNCLGSAILADSKCPKCWARIEKFVGMVTPIPVISQNTGNASQEGEWSVEETERLAATAASSDTVIVIHPLEDRPSPLYSSRHQEILDDRWSLVSCHAFLFLQEPLYQELKKVYIMSQLNSSWSIALDLKFSNNY